MKLFFKLISSSCTGKTIKTALSVLAIFSVIMCTTANINKTPDRRTIENSLHKIETAILPEIERLFGLCAENGIAVDYEMVEYLVIKDFVNYLRDDIQHRNTERAAYGLNCLIKIYDNVLASLNAYIAGTKRPWEVTRYVTGSVDIRGGSLVGKAVNSVTGAQITRPLFFTGYGHFDQIIKDMPKMTGYGVDILQTEIGPRDTVIEQVQGYGFNAAGDAIRRTESILREAEKNNVRVDVLLAPHYFPEWVFRKFPNLRENTGGFLTFNIYEPEAKKVIETHIIGTLERIKDYKSLNSVCISNEPVFSTASNFNVNNINSAVNVMWRQYLADTHGTIDALNSVYRTNYRSFDSVPMPRGIEASVQFYDWMTFNDLVFGGWHQWMAELIHETAPDVPVHSKIMDAVLSPTGGRSSLLWGIDAECFAQFSQLNGNDSYNLLFSSDAGITSKMKWYDFLMSLKKMPIFNSEDHIIGDRDRNYIPQQAVHVRSDIWQGAIHGRAASTIWVWERTHERNSDFAGSVLHRPDVVSAVGRTNLDLNRLAHEVTALQNEPARTAILFSNPSRIYDGAYLSTLDKIYNSLIFNGQKAGFITERQLAAGVFANYSVIIVPSAVHVTPVTLGAIRKFINNGGKTLIAGEESLSRDHYDRAIAGEDRTFIMENSTILKNAELELEIADAVRNILAQSGLRKVTLKDINTGNPVYGVEWLCAEYDGKILVNICNYEWSGSKSIAVFIGEKPVGYVTELITGGVVNAGNLELAPYTPVLLRVD
jgi:hypothetical protein